LHSTAEGIFSLMADFANLLAFLIVFWFDFSAIKEHHGTEGSAINLKGVRAPIPPTPNPNPNPNPSSKGTLFSSIVRNPLLTFNLNPNP
jgi:hypothetical protein